MLGFTLDPQTIKNPRFLGGLVSVYEVNLGCLEREADVDPGVGVVPVVGPPCSGSAVGARSDEEAERISRPWHNA